MTCFNIIKNTQNCRQCLQKLVGQALVCKIVYLIAEKSLQICFAKQHHSFIITLPIYPMEDWPLLYLVLVLAFLPFLFQEIFDEYLDIAILVRNKAMAKMIEPNPAIQRNQSSLPKTANKRIT